ncbi:rhodanese-like domain-containing protein [Parafrankia sp. FMc6]|uniref:rhodanese-like domain-containing protein n=1 Tax=Parafrankia soli TaxID=2599596 RepID=UPI0034D47B2B
MSESRVDAMLGAARARLRRLTPEQAAAALADGAVLIDIRPAAQRAAEGSIPAAVVIERNVLEWRLDPTCEARAPFATGDDIVPIVICSEGYTSSLAAASLQDLGLPAATDVIGGFHAWAAADLPTTS